MKLISKIYHFLGGVYVAIGLIAITACFVVAGTFIESKTDSHLYASYFTYSSPFFAILLWLFFVNILFSATRRWPFKMRHIPFLITHLGLLMIIGGTLIKNSFGVQGTMTMLEGSGTNQISLAGTYALSIEKREGNDLDNTRRISLPISLKEERVQTKIFPELSFKVISFHPHVKESLSMWIKGNQGIIQGFPPFPVYSWDSPPHLLPMSTRIQTPQQAWDVLAVKTDQIQDILLQAYLQGTTVLLSSKDESRTQQEIPLLDLIQSSVSFANGTLHGQLKMDYSLITGLTDPNLSLTWISHQTGNSETIKIPLQNSDANHPNSSFFPVAIELTRTPLLLFIQDFHDDVFIFAFGPTGMIFNQSFRQEDLHTFIAYDGGYGGYGVHVNIPIEAAEQWDDQAAKREELTRQLRHAIQSASILSPPLQLLSQACHNAQEDFTEIFPLFLDEWKNHQTLLFSKYNPPSARLVKVLNHIDWSVTPISTKEGCYWISLLFDQLESPFHANEDLVAFLERKNWPLLKQLHEAIGAKYSGLANAQEILSLLAQQILTLSDALPKPNALNLNAPSEQALLLSAYLKAYDIDYFLFDALDGQNSSMAKEIVSLESPITLRYRQEIPFLKLENNIPLITLEAKNQDMQQLIALSYQPFGTGFKWPILGGSYLIRFQPQSQTIPYRVRLRQARRINYPHTGQPYSFESDLIISRDGQKPVETTLSMNHVYETWDGYRFYLSSIAPETEGSVKRVQIVVNHDPAKYLLTYPGACILTLGILLLFWMKPYSAKGQINAKALKRKE